MAVLLLECRTNIRSILSNRTYSMRIVVSSHAKSKISLKVSNMKRYLAIRNHAEWDLNHWPVVLWVMTIYSFVFSGQLFYG